MRYTILGFTQTTLTKYNLNLTHALILRYIIDLIQNPRIVTKEENGKKYYWIKYKELIEDLPILNIKKNMLYKRLKELVKKEILDHCPTKDSTGTFSFYAIGKNYKELLKGIENIKYPVCNILNTPIENIKEGSVKNYITNNPSTNPSTISNNNGTSKEVQKNNISNDPLGIGNINKFEIPKKYKKPLAIIKSMKDMGLSCSLPKNKISKTLTQAIKYLLSIKSGSFIRDVSWDKKWTQRWIKKWPDKNGYQSWGKVRTLVLNSLENMLLDKKENRLVGGTMWFPERPEDFFFYIAKNKQTGKSMFLKYMNIKPKTSTDYITEFQKSGISKSVQNMIEDVLGEKNKSWTAQQTQRFWINMRKLCTWYEDNRDWVEKEDKQSGVGMFGMRMYTLDTFFQMVVIPYLKSIEPLYFPNEPIPAGIEENSKWRRFCDWLYHKDHIKLDDWAYE